jgi:hypothetical protein
VDRPTLTAYNMGNSLEERVRLLRKLCWDPNNGVRAPRMLYIARQVVRSCPARDLMCELQKIFWFTVTNVRYTGDIAGVDTFSSPMRTLQMGGEDCDGHTVLNAALAILNGYQAKARITSNKGVTWDHIYCMVGLPKGRTDRWIALDTTLGAHRFGIEPPRAKYQDFALDMP